MFCPGGAVWIQGKPKTMSNNLDVISRSGHVDLVPLLYLPAHGTLLAALYQNITNMKGALLLLRQC